MDIYDRGVVLHQAHIQSYFRHFKNYWRLEVKVSFTATHANKASWKKKKGPTSDHMMYFDKNLMKIDGGGKFTL